MSTYEVRGPWEKSKKGYLDDKGNLWSSRRHIGVYERGTTQAIEQKFAYKNLIKEKEPDKPPEPPADGTKPGDQNATNILGEAGATDLTGQLPGDVQQGLYGGPQLDLIGPSGDPRFAGWSPTDIALFQHYGAYLNQVDAHNNALKAEIEDFYKTNVLYYGMSAQEANDGIKLEYNSQRIPRLNFEQWKIQAAQGNLKMTDEFTAPTSVINEMQKVDEFNAGVDRFLTGAGMMWDILSSLGIPQIITSGIVRGKDIQLSDIAQGIAYREPAIINSLDSIAMKIDDIAFTNQPEGEAPYKEHFEKLEEQAQKSGIIKGKWTLRLSQAIPIRERWRRLYMTLKDHIKKRSKR